MKLGTKGAERTFWVREQRKARLNSRFDAELLPDSLRDQKRIQNLLTPSGVTSANTSGLLGTFVPEMP
ncbi:hypothetical protein PbDSM24746_30800 [Paenibacillus macerans]|nr:hypothetical protein PbDSM24746_30800 [Paenibacillus macerans]GBK69389.1 hypothetical protein PbJCM17693_30970 [Paenibacillus macerans]